MPTPRDGDIRIRMTPEGAVELIGSTDRVADAMDRMGASARRANVAGNRLQQDTRTLGASIQDLDRRASLAAKAFTGLFVVHEITRFTGALGESATAWTQYTNRIDASTQSNIALAAAQRGVFELSQELNQEIDTSASVFQKLTNSTKELALTQDDVLKLQKTITQLGIAGGNTAQEVSSGLLQMTQGFAAGALQGDEFRSVAENMPGVLTEVSRSLGKTRDELDKMSEAGELTAEVFIEALAGSAEIANQKFQEMQITAPAAATALANSWTRAIGVMDQALGVSENLARVMKALSGTIDDLVDFAQDTQGSQRAGILGALGLAGEGELETAMAQAHAEVQRLSKELDVATEAAEKLAKVEIFNQVNVNRVQRLKVELSDAKDRMGELQGASFDLSESFKGSTASALNLGAAVGGDGGGGGGDGGSGGAPSLSKAAVQAKRDFDALIVTLLRTDTVTQDFINAITEGDPILTRVASDTTHAAFAGLDEFIDELERQLKEAERESEKANKNMARDAIAAWGDFFSHIDNEWASLIGNMIQGVAALITQLEGGAVTFDNLGSIAAAGGVGGGIGSQFGGLGGLGGLGGAAGGIGGGLLGSFLAESASGFLATALPGIGSVLGGVLGGLVGSLFGGENQPSPEISIGGALTETGVRAGTQGQSIFGSFGIRDPRGADPVTEFAGIASLIANTDALIARFLTSEQIGDVSAARSQLQITMDSDEDREINLAINHVFGRTLRAVSESLEEIFSAETIGGTIDAAIGAEVAASLLELNDALQRIGVTLSQEVVDAAGGAQEALALTNSYIARFFRPDEIALISLERANSVVEEQFGDLVDQYGLNAQNFREIFEQVQPQGEDFVRWLQLAEALGVAEDATEAYDEALDALNDTVDDVVDAVDDADDSLNSLLDSLQEFADTINAVLADILDLRAERTRLVGEMAGTTPASEIFQRGAAGPLAGFIMDFDALLLDVRDWDGSLESLAAINRGMEDFQRNTASLALSIQRQVGVIRQATEDAIFGIDRDIARIEGGQRGEYDFLREFISDLSAQINQSGDPNEIAQLQARRNQLAREAWALLSDDQRQIFADEFREFFTGAGSESVVLLETMRDNIINVADTLIEYTSTWLGIQDSVLPIPEIRDLILELPTDIAEALRSMLPPWLSDDPVIVGSISQGFVSSVDKMADVFIPNFDASLSRFDSAVDRVAGAAAVIDIASRRALTINVETSDSQVS